MGSSSGLSYTAKYQFSEPVMVGLCSMQISPQRGSEAAELLLGQQRRALTPITHFSLAPPVLRSGLCVQPWFGIPRLPCSTRGGTGLEVAQQSCSLFKRCQGSVQPPPGCRNTTLCHKKKKKKSPTNKFKPSTLPCNGALEPL